MTQNEPDGAAQEEPTTAGDDDYGGPLGYPVDPGAAYESEPEAPDEAFSEPQHWVEPGRQRRDR